MSLTNIDDILDKTPTERIAASAVGVRITRREIQVLTLISQGLTAAEAAEKLIISKRTVDSHESKIRLKLRAKNRVQAVRAAVRFGLIPFEPNAGW